MLRVTFYSTEACHLCDQAKEILKMSIRYKNLEVLQVDISDSDDLIALYGVRIPVLKRCDTQQEISWPFDIYQLENFLS